METAVAKRFLGLTCLIQGDFAEAEANLDFVHRTYDPVRDNETKFRFGTDSAVGAALYLAHTNWLLGNSQRARELQQEAIGRATQTDHVVTLANAHFFSAVLEIFRDDAGAAKSSAASCVEVSREHSLELYLAQGTLCLDWARARLGERDEGIGHFRLALTEYKDQGNKFCVPLFQGLLAELEAETMALERGRFRVAQALQLASLTGEHWTDALLHRIRGEILLKLDPSDTRKAEEAFLTAIRIAQQQKARSFELRAAISMARLWRDQGRRDEARDLLAPVYGWFTEGFDTRDLKKARALLDELAA
jgi:predicted ATPase